MAPIIWTSRNQTRLFAETKYFARKRGRTLNRGQTGKAFQTVDCVYHHKPFPRGPEFQQLSDIHDVHVCPCCHRAPNNPGQVEILITPDPGSGVDIDIVRSPPHWPPEAVTTIRVQTRDRIIIIIIVVVCREKERF